MRALLLAAGRGSRIGGLTQERPKCMVEFAGGSVLSWQQQALADACVSKIAIVTGYSARSFRGEADTLFQNPRRATTNMVRSLEAAHTWLSEESCIVSYSDLFYGSDAVSTLARCVDDVSVLFDSNWRLQWEERFGDPLLDAETFSIGSVGAISEIGRRAATCDEIDGQYMGPLLFTPPGWLRLPVHFNDSRRGRRSNLYDRNAERVRPDRWNCSGRSVQRFFG